MIREIRSQDLESIYLMGHDIYTWIFEKISWNRELVNWFYKNFPDLCFIYEENEHIIGFVLGLIDNNIGYIGWIAVLDEKRKNGIGNLLLSTLLIKYQEKNINSLAAHVRDEIAPISLFTKLGFQQTSERKIEMIKDINTKHIINDNPFVDKLFNL